MELLGAILLTIAAVYLYNHCRGLLCVCKWMWTDIDVRYFCTLSNEYEYGVQYILHIDSGQYLE